MSAEKMQSAFPAPANKIAGYHENQGMTLRDYLAAHCPITWEEARDYNMSGESEMEFFAAIRYEYADAMIAERAK